MEGLAQEGRLGIYRHNGFWQCMDTQRDKIWLEERRMFYVGMTRAKKELTLLYVTGEKGTKKESGAGVMPPSRFLKEIRETL